jgi:hypothetical protein
MQASGASLRSIALIWVSEYGSDQQDAKTVQRILERAGTEAVASIILEARVAVPALGKLLSIRLVRVQVTAVGETPLSAGFDLDRVGSVAGRDVDHSGRQGGCA